MKRKTLALLLCLLSLVSLSACAKEPEPEAESGIVYSWESDPQDNTTIPVTAPKTAFNPLTGEYNMATDRVGMRPICVAADNIEFCWPQSGLSQADVLIECEVEAGITRFLALYSDVREVPKIGNIRSLRHQYLEAVHPLDPLFVHIGWGSVEAYNFLQKYYDLKTLDAENTYGICYKDLLRFNAGYWSEQCFFTNGRRIYEAARELQLPDRSTSKLTSFFSFANSGQPILPAGGTAQQINFFLSENHDYDGDFRYDADLGAYLKYQRDEPQLDVGEGTLQTQLAFQNVLVLFAEIETIDTLSYMAKVTYAKGGEGYYFSNGSYERFTWTKPDVASNFVMTKLDGAPLVLNPGKTIISLARNTNIDTLQIQ